MRQFKRRNKNSAIINHAWPHGPIVNWLAVFPNKILIMNLSINDYYGLFNNDMHKT